MLFFRPCVESQGCAGAIVYVGHWLRKLRCGVEGLVYFDSLGRIKIFELAGGAHAAGGTLLRCQGCSAGQSAE